MRSCASPARAAAAAAAAAAPPPSRSGVASHGRGMTNEKLPVRYLWVLSGSAAGRSGRTSRRRTGGGRLARMPAPAHPAAMPRGQCAGGHERGAARQGGLSGGTGGAAALPGRQRMHRCGPGRRRMHLRRGAVPGAAARPLPAGASPPPDPGMCAGRAAQGDACSRAAGWIPSRRRMPCMRYAGRSGRPGAGRAPSG